LASEIFLDPLAVEALLYNVASSVFEDEISLVAAHGDFVIRIRPDLINEKLRLVYVLEKIT
jgi:hypothetical protein